MKKQLMAGIAAGISFFALAATAAGPGTDSDPLISKSYIDSVVYPYIDKSVAASGGSPLEIVNVGGGDSIICGAGTELILRSGRAEAIDSANGGLCDTTAGADVRGGEISPNHLLIIPRDDGRGAYADTDCIFMVRGYYYID